VRLAEGREGASCDRRRRGARHRSRRCRARSLASRPQPAVRWRTAKTLQPQQASGLAGSAEVDAMRARTATLALMAAATALASLTVGPKPVPRLVWNASESVPMGLYGVQSARRLIVTALVVPSPPEPLATFLADGGYVPRGVPLIKRVLALPEQMVCRNDFAITVDGIEMGAARERDRRGRPLPIWQGCRVVPHGEVFLMNWDEPASLDSRYFGPLPLTAVVGRAVPLWTFEDE